METREINSSSSRDERTCADPTLSAIMPAYNCHAYIKRTLAPLIAMQNRRELCEIIVVDDGSTDGTGAAAAALGARVIASDGRCGPGAARNLGAQHASGNILWFVDADVVARKDAVPYIRRALADHDYVAVFGSYDDAPPARNFLSQYKNLVHHYYHQNGRGEASTFWAGCGAVRKSAFMAAGGFDALRYPRPSIEDIELGYRLRASGGRIRLSAELQGTHLKVWTLRGLLTTELRDRALPWASLLLSRGHAGDELNVAVAERIRALIACFLIASIVASAIGLTPWWVLATFLAMAFAANLELFALFRRRNGLLFAIGSLLFHQFYYLYSTAAYCWCWFLTKGRTLVGSGPIDTKAMRG
jgi:glycosyltransferase involved in cell wall biosynthesis